MLTCFLKSVFHESAIDTYKEFEARGKSGVDLLIVAFGICNIYCWQLLGSGILFHIAMPKIIQVSLSPILEIVKGLGIFC